MKLLSFIQNGKKRIGAVNEQGRVVDLTALGCPDNMNDIIDGVDTMKKRIAAILTDKSLPAQDLASLKFTNVTSPQKIICVGLNYRKHAEETGGTAPENIIFFSKFNDALVPSLTSVTLPEWQRCYDYEAELVIIIGKSARNVPVEQALDYVFGYTCGNDLSARDSQFLTSQWLAGKAFPGFGPAGPVLVTADSFNPNADHGIYCEVNGVQVQSSVTSDMIFNCAEIVSKASQYFGLSAGDLIFTGTPSGVVIGKEKDKRVWLKPGDVVKVSIDGIGSLVTPLI